MQLLNQKGPIHDRPQRRKQAVAREPVEGSREFQAAIVAKEEAGERAFGLRELFGREIDGIDDENQMRSRF